MPQPGSLQNHLPPSSDWLIRRLQELERKVEMLAGARTLTNASIDSGSLTIKGGQLIVQDASGNVIDTIDANGITVTGGSIAVTGGNLTISGSGLAKSGNYAAGAAGWKLDSSGNAEFNNITLRGGIIGDDALANPVTGDVRFAGGSNYSLSPGTPGVARATASFTVPTGFTQVIIQVVVNDSAINSTASTDILQSYCKVLAPSGAYFDGSAPGADAPSHAFAASTVSVSGLLGGLSGGNAVQVTSQPYTNTTAWAASTGNATSFNAFALFLR